MMTNGLISDYRFKEPITGNEVRVVVAGDVLALPDLGWSRGGFGESITVDWLLREGNLPGPAERRRMLATLCVSALNLHHKGGA